MVAEDRVSIEEFAASTLEGRWELEDGKPVEIGFYTFRSALVAGALFFRLAKSVEGENFGWAFGPGVGVIPFPDRETVFSPTVSFFRRDRLPELTDQFVPIAPDLAAEVLSPGQFLGDALARVAMYLQAGVRLIWLVDPERRTVTVFRPDETIAVLHDGETLDAGDVVPEFRIAVSEIFA